MLIFYFALFSFLKVHLGFIKCYTIVPPRGAIVSSNPRPWLSVTDIQKAFYAGKMIRSSTFTQFLMY